MYLTVQCKKKMYEKVIVLYELSHYKNSWGATDTGTDSVRYRYRIGYPVGPDA